MTVRNRPKEYVKRSALVDRKACAVRKKPLVENLARSREFSKANIDDRFYFTFKKVREDS